MSVSNPNLTMHVGTNSCKGCNRPDTEEDMVACDKCNGWWHFSCAGVQASICDRSWRCPNCSTFCGTIGSEHSNASSARLRLKQLEEAKALEDKIRKEQADKEREFLAAKHQLESEIEARQSVSGSLRSHGSHRSRRSRVGTWVAEQDFTIGNRAIENPPETGKTSTPILTGQVGTGATAKILPPPQLNTQEQQQKYPTEQQQSYATLTNERKKGLPPNTPLSLPKQLLPPAKPPGIPEPSFFPVNSSRTLEQKIPVAETTTTTKSVLASLNPMATTEPSHFSITLGAMQSQRLPAGPMNTAAHWRGNFLRQSFHPRYHSQRFLWRTNPESTPDVYTMDVVTFGATCSPCSAQYAKNLNAADYEAEYPEAARAITKNTYVDDYLDSRDTIEEAVQLAVSVREVHSKAGFELRNWHSNAQEILNRIGAENSSEAVKSFTADKTTATERILGMMWEPTEDLFVFFTQFHEDLLPLLSGETVPTKRQVLRVVMSLFDPLGLISCFTVHGKILLQNIWRSGVGWDDPLIPRDFLDWQRWTKVLPELNRLQIPRCYFPDYERESNGSLQLHIFVDASELAYCGVAYFRIIDRGTPRCSLVAAKAKVTPLRPQSIPRNELNAGVIGVRLMKSVTENHSLQITKRYFHTDSTVLLAWLRADPRKYRPYVQFRTTEILTDTKVEEWRWVPTRLNIADEATKWGNGPSFDVQDKWYRGPDFLWQPESEWPVKKPLIEEPTDELRKTNVHQEVTTDPVLEFTKFSSWEDLIKSLAYLYHFINRCSTKQRVPTKSRMATLTHQDFVSAEKGLWRMVQNQEFGEEISSLQSSESSTQKSTRLPKSSPLAKLSTFLDDDGILRSESRIDPKAAYYPYNFQNPIIVPKYHYVTDLLILRFHRLYGHANTETVLNELRQLYCIPKMRSVVKKTVKKCMWCRVYRAKPEAPRMAPLPQPRVMPFVRPFTHTGIDYFGPLIVKQGRSNVKRELAAEIKNINLALAGSFTNAETEWHFNPPSAPHMGGMWERKVRSIKDAFKVLAHREKLDDEGLLTLLSEATMIVNSRPLTFVPLESPEREVLTPNSFLLMSTSSGSTNLVRVPIDQPISLRTNWGVMLHLLNQFWKT
ncbi:uncharacterized protein LOC134284496 [Aedes albopictus]|uniref:PHD-type domain-containing protein n=1 Tax=Aedes albopictus TaxID=7160 RepID=A0ABM2A6C4_AEDAL